MSRAEDQIAGRIDRRNAKAETSARTLQVREMAKASINCAVQEQPANDQPEFIRAAIHHLRLMYGKATDEQSAVALFGSLAWSGEMTVRRAVSAAEAERLFAKAANDEGERNG